MRKRIAMFLSLSLLVILAGCGADETDTTLPPTEVQGVTTGGTEASEPDAGQDPEGDATTGDGGVLQPSAEVLEMLGMSAEEFGALEPEVRQAILSEVGAKLENDGNGQTDKKDPVTYTPEDVMAGGSYVVVLGDYMNSITLYYENGVLVKLVEDFQKSFEEEASSVTYEGEALEEYSFNFIDWSGAALQEILDGMADYGGYGQYTIRKVD